MAKIPNLGGVRPDEIRDYALEAGVPDTAGASLITRFVKRVSDLVGVRAAKGETGQFTVFLKIETLPDHAEPLPRLRNGEDSVADKVWMTSASLETAAELQIAWSDAKSLFGAIGRAGFGDLPAVVVDWRSGAPIGHLYRAGVKALEDCEPIVLEQLPISRGRIKEVLDHFYEKSLRTPTLIIEGHGKRIWNEAAKGVPEYRPEEAIQGRLVDVLKAVFVLHSTRAEPVTEDGRADIVIYKKDTSTGGQKAIVNEWVLELKALADRTSKGNPVAPGIATTAVRSGLEQVVAYKAQLNAVHGALCCYDMRADDVGDDSCFSHVTGDAIEETVVLWRWYLFRSTAASRAAKGYLSSASA